DIGQVKQHGNYKGWQGGYGLSSGLNIQYQQAQLDLEVAKGELLYHQTNSNKTKDPTQLLVKFSYLF
ncbi:ShlB/FhaC/HecB family hemolysin secretion/activation protein, partial [Proteus mirabilis]